MEDYKITEDDLEKLVMYMTIQTFHYITHLAIDGGVDPKPDPDLENEIDQIFALADGIEGINDDIFLDTGIYGHQIEPVVPDALMRDKIIIKNSNGKGIRTIDILRALKEILENEGFREQWKSGRTYRFEFFKRCRYDYYRILWGS